MKLPWIVFVLLLAMCGVVVATFFIEEVPHEGDGADRVYLGHGFDHPEFSSMQRGGSGEERHGPVLWLGWIFGILQIVFFVCCLALGARKNEKVGPFVKPLAVGGVGFAATFTLMVLSYQKYMTEDTHLLFLAQVKPSAWMVYALWGFPTFFIILYIATFKSWSLTDEDLETFRNIMKRKDEGGAKAP